LNTLRTLVRCLLALFLWIGVSGAASVPAAPASVNTPGAGPQASQSDLQARLLDLLGGVQICGDEESDEDDVLCGGDLLAGLVVDPAMLLMSRGTCSRLLEQLYTRQVCDPHKEDCGQLRRGALAPPQGPQLTPPSAAGGLLACFAGTLAPDQAALRALRARDGPDPASHSSRPIPPPPRAVLA
jgi:hypothetical protein